MEPQEINEDKEEILIDYYIQKVSERLRQLISPNERDKKRWIWELLQNAKDSVANFSNRKVDVIIELQKDRVVFSHNGSPFTPKALNSLIWQKSGEKRGHVESTGRFGTGFLTTHTLSQKVQVKSGLIESSGNEWTVELTLFREGERDEELKEGIQKTLNSCVWVKKKCEITSYSYFLKSETNKESAESGLKSLRKNVFYNLAFTPEINSITLNEGGQKDIFERAGDSKFENGMELIPFYETINGKKKKITIVLAKSESPNEPLTKKFQNTRTLRVSAAICYDVEANTIIPIDAENPFLFCLFPLIGTEKFFFPVIVNSPDFEPTTERDGIMLIGEEINKETGLITNAGVNRMILTTSVDLFSDLLKFASTNKLLNAHFLAKSDVPKEIDKEWFQENIQRKLRKEILETKLVIPAVGKEWLMPCETIFPVHTKNKFKTFWELCKNLIGTKIPTESNAEVWQSIVNSDKNDWNGITLKFELIDLLQKIHVEEKLENFKVKYFSNSLTDTFDYLKKVILFTETEDKDLLLDEKNPQNIYPDQNGLLVAKYFLQKDAGIPEELKDIFYSMNQDFRDELVKSELNDVFISKDELKLKDISDRMSDLIDGVLSKKVKEDEQKIILSGLFKLISLSPSPISDFHQQLFEMLKQLYPGENLNSIFIIENASTFDWRPCYNWAVRSIGERTAEFSDLNNLSNYLFNEQYPFGKEQYSEDENLIRFKTDSFIGKIIAMLYNYENNKFRLLEDLEIIPNQLNDFCLFDSKLFNDVYDKANYSECERTGSRIPEELKDWLFDLGANCRMDLLHHGVSIKLLDSRDLVWICGEIDKLIIKNQESHEPKIKEAIRAIDRWLQKEIKSDKEREKLFIGFYPKRHRIVYQTFTNEERANLDEIAKSGHSEQFVQILKGGIQEETVKLLVDLSNIGNLNNLVTLLQQHPELSSEKIERLLEIEELSKGWDTTVDYNPSDEQIRHNFENGWKGEAFVYKEMKNRNLQVEWPNKTSAITGNHIIDFQGEEHYIEEKQNKYDLIVTPPKGGKLFIQVKTTTTDIGKADQIALPITTREWKFIHETNENESYYLARVFNINQKPEVYFMKLAKPEEI